MANNNSKCPVCGRFTSKKNVEAYKADMDKLANLEKAMVDTIEDYRKKKKEIATLEGKNEELQEHVMQLTEQLRITEARLWDETHKSIWQRIFGK